MADPYAPLPKDLVGRRSDTGVLDRVWTSDIAYPRTGQCRQYLCAVRDGCSRRSIGWPIDEHTRTDLFESALAMAVSTRGEPAETVMVHADRGCQYTSAQAVHPRAQSGPFSRAHWRVAEKTLQPNHSGPQEKSSSTTRYLGPTRTAPKLAVGDWIERIYNRRRHSALGVLSPAEQQE